MEGFHRNYRYRKHTDCTQKTKKQSAIFSITYKTKSTAFSQYELWHKHLLHSALHADPLLNALLARCLARPSTSPARRRAAFTHRAAAARPAHRAASRLSPAHPAAGRLHAPRAQQLQVDRLHALYAEWFHAYCLHFLHTQICGKRGEGAKRALESVQHCG